MKKLLIAVIVVDAGMAYGYSIPDSKWDFYKFQV